MTAQPWDAERAAHLWHGLSPAEQQRLLTQNDALLLAAQGLKPMPNGQAQPTESKWKPIVKGITYMPEGPQQLLEQIAELYRDPKELKAQQDKADMFDFLAHRDRQIRATLKQAGFDAEPAEPTDEDDEF